MAKLTENAKDTGSETPANHARLELNDYWQKKAHSSDAGGQSEQNQQNLRMDFPITGKLTFRTDIPYVWKNGDVNGIGDIFTRMTYRVLDTPDFSLIPMCDFYWPTGAQPITQGRWQAGPGFQLNVPVAVLHSVAKFRIQEYFSYAGNSESYKSINYTQAQYRFYTQWSENS